jgi:hypothetical protein
MGASESPGSGNDQSSLWFATPHDWRSSLTRSMNAARRFTRSSEIAIQGDYFYYSRPAPPFIVAHLALLKLKYQMPRKRPTLVIVGASAPGPIRLFQLQRGPRHWLDTRSSSFPSMESPKWKRISDAKARVLIVDQIQPGVLQRTAVRFDLAKDKGIKRTSIFRTDFNDQLVLSTAFVDSCDFCGEWCHDRHSATLRGCELAKIESSRRRKWPNSLRIFR